MIAINETTEFEDVISLIKSPYFGLCNDYDKALAEWVSKNCPSYNKETKEILKLLLRFCPRGKELSPTISKILELIVEKPRRFTGKGKFVYRTVLGLRDKAPEIWKTFLENSEKVNKLKDWVQLSHDLGYDGPMDMWSNPELRDYVEARIREAASC
jgi:hypothetical protein